MERNGKYLPDYPTPFCPNCSSDLKINLHSHNEIACINDNYDWKYQQRRGRPKLDNIIEKLQTEILRKVRTGEYKQPKQMP